MLVSPGSWLLGVWWFIFLTTKALSHQEWLTHHKDTKTPRLNRSKAQQHPYTCSAALVCSLLLSFVPLWLGGDFYTWFTLCLRVLVVFFALLDSDSSPSNLKHWQCGPWLAILLPAFLPMCFHPYFSVSLIMPMESSVYSIGIHLLDFL